MKKTSYCILIQLLMISICNISRASHIKPERYNASLIDIPLNLAANPKPEASNTNGQDVTTRSPKGVKTKTFNQELQWRILNLLAQQLFLHDAPILNNDLFIKNWLYTTPSFSVDISSTNPNFYQVKIIDIHKDNATQLEIPKL